MGLLPKFSNTVGTRVLRQRYDALIDSTKVRSGQALKIALGMRG